MKVGYYSKGTIYLYYFLW